MDKLDTKLAELLEKLQGAATQIGPDVWATTLSAVSHQGMIVFCWGVFLLILAFALWIGLGFLIRDAAKGGSDGEGPGFCCFFLGLVAFIAGVIITTNYWIAAFHPAEALILRVLP